MKYSVHAARLLVGSWYLVNGFNWFVRMFPQSHGIDSRWFLETLMVSGLFSVVKAVQFFGGLCLVTNRFVPAGVACLMPISAVLAYNDIILEHGILAWIAGGLMLGLNIWLMVGYLEYFIPLMTVKSRIRGIDAIRDWRADWRPTE